MRITAVISVYREPKLAADSIAKLLRNSYRDKKVVVVVDGETNPAIEKALSKFRKNIRIIYNRKRYGKVTSLNRAVKTLSTDVIFFMDNDILLPKDRSFLDKMAAEMENYDISDLPKEAVQRSPISRMMGFEFLGFAMTTLTIARISGHCPSMNGAAFAVRQKWFNKMRGFRKVVNEDMDFAARSFRLKARYSYSPALKVHNGVPEDMKTWLVQRKRWALNNIVWLRDNFLMILSHMFKSPSFFLASMLMLLPFVSFIVFFIINKLLHTTLILPAIFLPAQQFSVLAGFFLWFSQYHLVFTEGLVPTISAFLFSGLIYFIFAKILKFRFNILEFILFYFIYSPVWLLANIVMWVLVIFRVDIKLDWKV
jgi:cellulose synthase/poly-beta-1,6-N-acetylglucosamine synthase-like glycosyltransferase